MWEILKTVRGATGPLPDPYPMIYRTLPQSIPTACAAATPRGGRIAQTERTAGVPRPQKGRGRNRRCKGLLSQSRTRPRLLGLRRKLRGSLGEDVNPALDLFGHLGIGELPDDLLTGLVGILPLLARDSQ